MLYVGLDLSRKRLDWVALDPEGRRVAAGAVPPEADGLATLARRLGDQVVAVIESMSGARYVHDQLERAGWEVKLADALKVRGLAPLACKTDRIDCLVLAQLARLGLVPEVWLPDPSVRGERELARFRLHLVKHRSALKNRVHALLFSHGVPNPHRNLFGAGGRSLLASLQLPEPWASTLQASLALIHQLDDQIGAIEREIVALAPRHRYMPRLQSCPGIGPILAFTIAAELGDVARFPSARKLVGYTGLTPSVEQSGERDRRGRLRKNGPNYLRWALIEAAHTAARDPRYRPLVERMRARHGRKRGSAIAALEIARRLSEAIWYMLTYDRPFAPAGAAAPVAA